MFRRQRKWQRSDTTFFQRCHSLNEVRRALRASGFRAIRSFHARKDLDMSGDLAIGRVFFRARKSGRSTPTI
jgi:hypothetical protein